jgi:Flp pilus assembly pilin Flp
MFRSDRCYGPEESTNETGVVAIEYVLLGAALIVALIVAFAVFEPGLVGRYDSLL